MASKKREAGTMQAKKVGACSLAAALLCLPGACKAAAPTPAAGTMITTAVTASYDIASGMSETSASNAASFVVSRAAGVRVLPAAGTLAAPAGQSTTVFTLQIQNTGTGSDVFDASVTGPSGGSAVLVQDGGGAPLALPLTLDAGQSAHCLLRVTCAGNAGGTATVRVRSQADGAQTGLFVGTVQAASVSPAGGASAEALHTAWEVQTGGPVLGEATVQNGVAYVGSDDGYLYAIAATSDSGAAAGTVLWRCDTHGKVRCAPAVYVAPGGQVQVTVGNDAGRLWTCDALSGAVLWTGAARRAANSALGSWRARPLVSADGSLVSVAGPDGALWGWDTVRGTVRRRAPLREQALAGNPSALDADGGAWLMGASGWGSYVRGGVPGRRVWLGGRAAGAWSVDTLQGHLYGVTAGGIIASFDTGTLLPSALWPVGINTPHLGVPVNTTPVLDSAAGLLYVAAADHAVYAVCTADGAPGGNGWPFVPPPTVPGATFAAAPLLWPSVGGGAATLYVGGTDGGFWAVPTDNPATGAQQFVPAAGDAPLGEWDAAPAASGTGPQDVVVAGNTNGIVYGLRLR